MHTLCLLSFTYLWRKFMYKIKSIWEKRESFRKRLAKIKNKKCPISILPVFFLYVFFFLLLLLNTQTYQEATPGNDVSSGGTIVSFNLVFFHLKIYYSPTYEITSTIYIVNFPFHSFIHPFHHSTALHDHPAHLTYQPYIIIT